MHVLNVVCLLLFLLEYLSEVDTIIPVLLPTFQPIAPIARGNVVVTFPGANRVKRTPYNSICIRDCTNVPNGDYHSCFGCLFFVTCSNGYTYDERICPWFGGLVWDDNKKRCEWESETCAITVEPEVVVVPPPPPICVSSCFERESGYYQSCNSCRVYVTCSNGYMYDNRPCPGPLIWDDITKRCEWLSRTCSGP